MGQRSVHDGTDVREVSVCSARGRATGCEVLAPAVVIGRLACCALVVATACTYMMFVQ